MKLNIRDKRLALVLVLAPLITFSAFLLGKGLESVFLEEFIDKQYASIVAVRNRILARKYQEAKPFPRPDQKKLNLEADAGIVVWLKQGKEKILFEKDSQEQLPIASLTKLMTALVAIENYNLREKVTFSAEAAQKEGDANFFKAGESFYVQDLIYSSLLESSNRAASALAEKVGEQVFVLKMNKKAQELGLKDTLFYNPTGLDPDHNNDFYNQSTARDLVKLAKRLLGNPLVQKAAQSKTSPIYQTNGNFHHQMVSTNKLLDKVDNILLAKTGHTPISKRCLVLSFTNEKDNSILVAVVLGANNSFLEAEKMINWVYTSYKW